MHTHTNQNSAPFFNWISSLLLIWGCKTFKVRRPHYGELNPRQDYFKRLPKRHHPDFHWLFLGAAGAKTPLHVDPSTTHAWLTQLSGRKRFTLFPPQELQRLRSDQKFRCLEEILRDKEVKPLEVILEPGEQPGK